MSFIIDPYRFAAPAPSTFWARQGAGYTLDSPKTTATRNDSSGNYSTVMGSIGRSSGRRAYEIICAGGTGDDYLYGIGNATVNPDGPPAPAPDYFYPGQNVTKAIESIGYWGRASSRMYYRGTSLANWIAGGGGIAVGNVITCDVDFAANLIRWYSNGTLIFTVNPTLYLTTFGSVEFFPAVGCRNLNTSVFIRGSGLAHLPAGSTEWDS